MIKTVNSSIKMQISKIIKIYLKVTNYHTHLGLEVVSQDFFLNQFLKIFLECSYFSSFLFFFPGSESIFEISIGTLIPGI